MPFSFIEDLDEAAERRNMLRSEYVMATLRGMVHSDREKAKKAQLPGKTPEKMSNPGAV